MDEWMDEWMIQMNDNGSYDGVCVWIGHVCMCARYRGCPNHNVRTSLCPSMSVYLFAFVLLFSFSRISIHCLACFAAHSDMIRSDELCSLCLSTMRSCLNTLTDPPLIHSFR